MHARLCSGLATAALLCACGGGGDAFRSPLSVQDDAFTVAPLEFGQTTGSDVDPLSNDAFEGGPARAGEGGNVRLELLVSPPGASLTGDGRRIRVARHGTGRVAIGYRVCTVQAPSVCAPGLAVVTVTRGPVQAEPLSVRGWTGDVVVGHSDLEVRWSAPVPDTLRVSDSGAVRIADHASPGRFQVQRTLCEPGVAGNCATQDIDVEVPATVAVQGRYAAGSQGIGYPQPTPWWSGPAGGEVDFGVYAAHGCSGSPDYSSSCDTIALPFAANDLPLVGSVVAFSAARPLSWPTGFRWPARPGQRVTLPSTPSLLTGPWPVPGTSGPAPPTARVLRYAQGSSPDVGAVPANARVPTLRWQTGSLHRADGSRPAAAQVALGLLRGRWPSVAMDVDGADGSAVMNLLAGAFFDVRDDDDMALQAEGGFRLRLPPWGARTRPSGSTAPMLRFDVLASGWTPSSVRATALADGSWQATVDQPGLWAVADLLPVVQVRGCVEDQWRRPVANATVRLRADGQTTQALARTDAGGRFVARIGGQGSAELVAERDLPFIGGYAAATFWNTPEVVGMMESDVDVETWGSFTAERVSAPLPFELSGAADQRLDRCLQVDADPLLDARIYVGNDLWQVRETIWVLPDGSWQRVVNRSSSRLAIERFAALQVGRYSLFSSVAAEGPANPGDEAAFDRVTELTVPGQAPVRVSLRGVERDREVAGRHWHVLDVDVDEGCGVTVVPRRTLVDAPPPQTERYSLPCIPR